ncbi:rna-directed dna polymerase from mobile element jockey-like [Limosa lapponica baueri]|uniref:Rna-directed dna polymerase from mobile element jockey-like n=1 Tax=Limosa lapponica baueri TaxID=1758121 RepID=A0A2I0U7L5_LIMLA|nr:rna-directed dna polymerase from mobile element jockey-like [Limosa lapponica baueri]
MKGKANKGDLVLGVCYRPPNQDEQADELFFKRLGEVSQSTALVLVGDFNLPDICWKYNTAESRQARRFLECMEDNFLTQLVRNGVSKTSTLDFQREDFSLFRTLVGRVPWEIVLRGKGVQEGWTLFKKEILKAQEQAVPMRRKIKGWGKWLAWLNKELLMGLRGKKEGLPPLEEETGNSGGVQRSG